MDQFLTAEMAPPKKSFRVVYLPTTQFTYGAYNACPTVAAYWAFYLLYSPKPRLESLEEYLRLASEDWNEGLRSGVHKGEFEHVTMPVSRHPLVSKSMKLDDDLERHGLVLASEKLYQQVPPAFLAIKPVLGLRSVFEDIERVVRSPDSGKVRSFVFSRGGSTMGGSCRLLSDGRVRWDIVDSHQRFISFSPPEHHSSAIWAQCYSIDEALAVMLDMFKPATKIDDLLSVAQNDYIEQKRPASMYSVTVFKKEFATPEEAERHYAAKNREWGYTYTAPQPPSTVPPTNEEVFA